MGTEGQLIPRLLTLEQAAAYLGRTVQATNKLVQRKVFPVVRIDRRVQVDRVDLDKLIEGSKA